MNDSNYSSTSDQAPSAPSIRDYRIAEVRKGLDRRWVFTPLNGKIPLNKEWTAEPAPAPGTVFGWATSGNIGLRTGSISGVTVLDDDSEDGAIEPLDAEAGAVEAHDAEAGAVQPLDLDATEDPITTPPPERSVPRFAPPGSKSQPEPAAEPVPEAAGVPEPSSSHNDPTEPINVHSTLAELNPGDTVVEAPAFEQDGWDPNRTGTTALIAPTSGQVNPPVGVLRAAAQGAFDVSRTPDSEPDSAPRYIGDLTLAELSQFGKEGSSPEALGLTDAPRDDSRPTLELEMPDFGRPGEAETQPGDPNAPESEITDNRDTPPEAESNEEFEPIGVKVTTPADESGLWNNDDKRNQRPGDRPAHRKSSPAPKPQRSWGLMIGVAAVVAVAGLAYFGLKDRGGTQPSDGTPSTGTDVQPKTPDPKDGKTPPKPESGAEAGSQETVEPPLPPADPAKIDQILADAERLSQRGRRAKAKRQVDSVLAADPNNSRALVLRSTLLMDEQNLDDALTAAEASVTADPEYADAHLTLGVVRQQRGDKAEAVAAYRRFLDLAPKSKFAPSIKRQVRRLEGTLGKGG